jgi:two-component system, LytTR family, response regulator
MKLNALIADDEFHAVENLKRLLTRYCPEIQVVATADTLAGVEALAKKHKPDVVFLDIKMPGGNTLDNFNAASFGRAQIVFVTAYDEFAIKAIKVGALDYILKPVHPDELLATAAKIKKQFEKEKQPSPGYMQNVQEVLEAVSRTNAIGVYVNGEYQLIPLNEIMAFEALGAYTKIYTGSNKLLTSSKNIGYYEELVDKNSFCRVHKSFMVNIAKIVSVDKTLRTIKMINNSLFPVSVRLMPGLMQHIRK